MRAGRYYWSSGVRPSPLHSANTAQEEEESKGILTSPKAPRPITFSISKSSLCSLMSFTAVVKGFTAVQRDAKHNRVSPKQAKGPSLPP